MSNVRVRYSKVTDGIATSRRNFTTADGREVKAELNFNNKTYTILDSTTNEVVASGGDTRNSNVLKIQCKDGLLALGVTFTSEARNREGSQSSGMDMSASGNNNGGQ